MVQSAKSFEELLDVSVDIYQMKYATRHPRYNQLPVDLISLNSIIQNLQVLKSYFLYYEKRLTRLTFDKKTGVTVNRDNYKEHMGNQSLYFHFMSLFKSINQSTVLFDDIFERDIFFSLDNTVVMTEGYFPFVQLVMSHLVIQQKSFVDSSLSFLLSSYSPQEHKDVHQSALSTVTNVTPSIHRIEDLFTKIQETKKLFIGVLLPFDHHLTFDSRIKVLLKHWSTMQQNNLISPSCFDYSTAVTSHHQIHQLFITMLMNNKKKRHHLSHEMYYLTLIHYAFDQWYMNSSKTASASGSGEKKKKDILKQWFIALVIFYCLDGAHPLEFGGAALEEEERVTKSAEELQQAYKTVLLNKKQEDWKNEELHFVFVLLQFLTMEHLNQFHNQYSSILQKTITH